MTQNARLLNFLKEHPQGLTQLTAFNALGCCRLSERGRELEQLGYVIEHSYISVPTREGKTARVVLYRLISEPETMAA